MFLIQDVRDVLDGFVGVEGAVGLDIARHAVDDVCHLLVKRQEKDVVSDWQPMGSEVSDDLKAQDTYRSTWIGKVGVVPDDR